MLLLLAAVGISALLVSSDFAPESASTFSEAARSSNVIKVICTVQSLKSGPNGWTLRLTDGQGSTVGAFLVNASGPPPAVGSIIEAAGSFNDAKDFFFVQGFEQVYAPDASRASG